MLCITFESDLICDSGHVFLELFPVWECKSSQPKQGTEAHTWVTKSRTLTPNCALVVFSISF
jgi:hypothetical protein